VLLVVDDEWDGHDLVSLISFLQLMRQNMTHSQPHWF